jgi:hypothetical protein
VAALSLTAVGGLQGESGVALPADFLVAIELLGNGCDGGVHNSTPQTEHQVQGGLLLDVVVGQTSSV